MAKKKDDVSVTSTAYDVMQPRIALVNALLGGTETMRAAGETYLPRHTEESVDQYQQRLACTVLFNATSRTLEQLTGKVFKEPVELGEDVPSQIANLAGNIDGLGNKFHAFCTAWFRDGMAKGLSHVLVDFPPQQQITDASGAPRQMTLTEARDAGRRPYWVHIAPENVIFAMSRMINGVEKLTHVRIRELERVPDGFTEVFVERIRVLEPGSWALYEKDRRGRWQRVEEGFTSLDFIPFVTFYAGQREDLHLCKPPLTDLAYLNITHWQSSSDQRNVLTVARFPMLALSGKQTGVEAGETDVRIGPNQLLMTSDPAGKYYYVEHTGAAIKAGSEDLQALEKQMETYGSEFLKKQPGSVTATETAVDEAESVSELGMIALNFKEATELALQYTAAWINEKTGGTVVLNSDLSQPAQDSASELTALQAARTGRDITRLTYLTELQRRGVLSEELDLDEEAAQADKEAADQLAAFATADGGGDDPNDGNAGGA